MAGENDEETQRRGMLVKRNAEATLHEMLEASAGEDLLNPASVRVVVIQEDGSYRVFRHRRPAESWAHFSNLAAAICMLRSVEVSELAVEEVAVRVAKMSPGDGAV